MITAAALRRATAQELRALSEGTANEDDSSSRSVSRAVESGELSSASVSRHDDDLSMASLLACLAALVGINARDAEESTPLMVACAGENVEAVRVLLHCGADIEVMRGDGETALHVAVRGNAPQCAALLLAKGASPSAPNRLGDTPLDLARKLSRDKLLRILQQFATSSGEDAVSSGGATGSGSGGASSGGGGAALESAPLGATARVVQSARSVSRKRSNSDKSLAAGETNSQRRHSQRGRLSSSVSASAVETRRSSLPVAAPPATLTKKLTFRAKIAKKFGSSSDVSEELQKAWIKAANQGNVDALQELLKKHGSQMMLVRDRRE